MKKRWKAAAAVVTGFLFTFLILTTAGRGPRVLAQGDAAAQGAKKPMRGGMAMPSEGKTAGETFKNIQVLKDIPASELIPTMEFVSTSLGVECSFCHVMGHFDSDQKRPKDIARMMMRMELAIDKENFNGRQEVTCYTCHNGSTHPKSVPAVAESGAPSRPEGEGGEEGMRGRMASLPKPDAILAKYIQALGGEDALAKVKTRVVDASTEFFGRKVSLQITEKAPDMRISETTMGNGGKMTTAFDGKSGWASGGFGPEGRLRQLSGSDLAAAQLDAALAFPTQLKTLFRGFRPMPPEKIDGKEAYGLMGFRPGVGPTFLYFDETSGLLVRVVSFEQTGLGRLPQQTDYSDYREVDGVKVPYSWTVAQPRRRTTTTVTSVKQNVPVEDAKFAMPAAASNEQ